MEGVSKMILGTDVVFAIAQAKTDFKFRCLREYEGRDLINTQIGKRGAKMFEADVGHARASDPQGGRGSRRLVLLVQSDRITEMYFTDDHYRPGSWRRILDF